MFGNHNDYTITSNDFFGDGLAYYPLTRELYYGYGFIHSKYKYIEEI